MLTPWAFFIVALAAGRITGFVVYDSLAGFNLGSGSKMSRRLDVWAWQSDGKSHPGLGGWARDKIGNLLVCTYCIGWWITLACWAAWVWGPRWAEYVLMAWAAAGAQSMFNVIDHRLREP